MALKFSASVIALTAPPGSGKSLWMIRRIVDEILHECGGNIYTNIPFNTEAIREYLTKEYSESKAKYADRLKKIPLEVVQGLALKPGSNGYIDVQEWVSDLELEDGYLIVDELHRACPKGIKTDVVERWTHVLGYPRHYHWRFIGISQNPRKVHPSVWDNAEARIYLTNLRNQKLKYFGITFEEIWNLKAAWGLPFRQWALADLEVLVKEKWAKSETEIFCLDPKYFPLYDSFAKDETEDNVDHIFKEYILQEQILDIEKVIKSEMYAHENALNLMDACVVLGFIDEERLHVIKTDLFGQQGHREEYERYSKWMYLLIILARRPVRILFTLAGIFFTVYMLFFGGIASCAKGFHTSMQASLGIESSSKAVEQDSAQNKEVIEKTPEQLAKEKRRSDLNMVSTWTPLQVLALLERSRDLMTEMIALKKIINDKDEDIEILVSEIKKYTYLVGMTTKEVVFKDGARYGLGEKIEGGPYEGLRVVKLDWRKRGAVLNDGTFLHLDHRVQGCKTCPKKSE